MDELQRFLAVISMIADLKKLFPEWVNKETEFVQTEPGIYDFKFLVKKQGDYRESDFDHMFRPEAGVEHVRLARTYWHSTALGKTYGVAVGFGEQANVVAWHHLGD